MSSKKKTIIVDNQNMQPVAEDIQPQQMSMQDDVNEKNEVTQRALETLKESAKQVDTVQKDAPSETEDLKVEEVQAVEDVSQSQKSSKSKTRLFIGIAVAFVCLIAIIIGYGSMTIHYQTCFMPGTYINDVDCSELEVVQVADIIEQQSLEGYTLEVLGKDVNGQEVVLGTILPGDIEMCIQDGLLNVQALFDQQNPFLWMEIWGNREVKHTLETRLTYSRDKLMQVVEEMGIFDTTQSQQPQDAYLSDYNEETGTYEIVPEVYGNTLDEEKVLAVINEALSHQHPCVNLTDADCYMSPRVTVDDEELIALRDTLNRWLSTRITYDWVGHEEVLDKEILVDWISVVDGQAVLDEDCVADYVISKSKKYDNYGDNRDFVTSLGVKLNLPSGAFGWKTNRTEETAALISLIKEGAQIKREPIYSSKAPRKDGNNIGSSYVEIDLTNQHLYLYKDGVLVLESLFVSGLMTDPECVTPQGVFRITYKTVNATLRGGDYAEFVYYWMPFHGNYGMHDATWRTEFGGDIYLTNGSHGCINLPLENAEVIYNYMYAGYPVICYY
ncbi:MAG: L,D-transpeptidase family protein [Lachnospiraceae bacterium]|nr:L,D-transpeptidase family protein [Lachnospiraceae bacterium]